MSNLKLLNLIVLANFYNENYCEPRDGSGGPAEAARFAHKTADRFDRGYHLKSLSRWPRNKDQLL